MKVFITGGSGFIGSHLADRLLARGDEVLVIDNFATCRRDNLKAHPKLKIVEDSICNEKLMNQLMQEFKPDLVVHAAASYKDPNNWVEDALTNVMGTAIVCQAMAKADIKRIIYFQTALCYGLKPVEQPVTLNHPILPRGSSYAISKTAAEDYVQLSGLDFVTFRLANAYGPRNISGPLPTFFKRLTTNQKCFVMDTRRDFVYIDDMIDCIMHAVDGKGNGTYHLSSGSDISIKELFDATTKALNMHFVVEVKPRQPDDVFSILLDPSRTKNEFGWKAHIPLVEGVSKTIQYYNEQGIEETFTHLKEVK
ncbi:NAD-dependent epimerase/dehydratase family protein [Holospora curviuscula]|uniref:UDP-glucose 4-epimerase n=1 Tax=Holospora curviuscula TaxID=1082868 RepID=A0A2S5R724_9PROT|nr:NAD-dependent epimerase/dehydratase family protein [Holospora curviuscula]PPE03139.1 UDP-glucose 4-epimerase [Holospora curviuscula]